MAPIETEGAATPSNHKTCGFGDTIRFPSPAPALMQSPHTYLVDDGQFPARARQRGGVSCGVSWFVEKFHHAQLVIMGERVYRAVVVRLLLLWPRNSWT